MDKLLVGEIIGICIGGAIVVGLLIALFVWLYRRHKRNLNHYPRTLFIPTPEELKLLQEKFK
jgi:cbb3-type cytochrome oxidase subunit 3